MGRKRTGRSSEMRDRAHDVAIKYLDCIKRGMGHEEAIIALSKRPGYGGIKTIEADLRKSRKIAILLDEYENSKHLIRKNPDWKGWPSEFDRWCEEERESFQGRLEEIFLSQEEED